MISTCSTFQSCRLNISDDLQRQGKCNDGCTRLVNPYWYLQLLKMTNQDLLYFWLSLRNLTLPHNLKVPPVMQQKKYIVNSNRSNYTTENYLHIASIMLFWKYMSCIRLWSIISRISHVLDFLSAMFEEGHVMLTVQLTVQYVQQPPLSIYPLNSSFHWFKKKSVFFYLSLPN